MASFKNFGELAIPSNESPSIEWKLPGFLSVLQFGLDCTFESSHFLFKNETLKIIFVMNGTRDYYLVQVVRSSDSSYMTNCVHKKGFKFHSSVWGVVDFPNCKSVFPQRISDLQRYAETKNITYFVEFSISDDKFECAELLPSIPLKLMKSSPPCKECGRANMNGQDILCTNLKELYVNELHCDFTINIGERTFKTHKAILAAQSKVFAAMLKHDMAEKVTNETGIYDCDPDAFHEFLLYLYSGQVEKFSDESVIAVYTIADKYGVNDLKEECIKYMKSNLSVEMFSDFIKLASDHEEDDLLARAVKGIFYQ